MIVVRDLGVDVLTAARQRIRNIFSNGLPVYLAFSGGKDSLVLADITVKMIEAGELDVKRLIVEFIDEEAIFPCVENIVLQWREKFLLMGARFDWYCAEVRHYNCLNQLENDESFICWDRRKRDCWIREPPDFAIRSHPLLLSGRDTYQEFLAKICDGPRMTGVRIYESVQRRNAIALKQKSSDLSKQSKFEPCYDWHDSDVWRYLAENGVDIPEAYLHLYQIGVNTKQLRISQFFSIDTAHNLSRIAQFYPNLMERILRREPAAYLVSLYWDSEMFRRSSRGRRQVEENSAPIDYRQKVYDFLADNTLSDAQRSLANDFRKHLLKFPYVPEKFYRKIYDVLIAGDPKRRTLRGIVQSIESAAAKAYVPDHAVLTVHAGSTRPGAGRSPDTARSTQGERVQS